jgi:putative DNA primase/helicase
MSSEDDVKDTIKPRLRAAGADMKNLFVLVLRHDKGGRVVPFTVPDDIPYLQEALEQSGAEVVLIDPIMGFLSEDIQSHNDASVRRALSALAQVAESYGCSIIGIRHLNKDQREKNPLYRGGGSIGISGQARIVLLIGKPPWTGDDDPERVVAVTKNNLIRRLTVPSLKFEVEEWDDDPDIPVVKWHGEVPISAEQLLQTPDGRKNAPAREEAEAAIAEILADGPMAVPEFNKQLRLAGIKLDTARNARRALDVHSYAVRGASGAVEAWHVHLAEHACPPGCRWVFLNREAGEQDGDESRE